MKKIKQLLKKISMIDYMEKRYNAQNDLLNKRLSILEAMLSELCALQGIEKKYCAACDKETPIFLPYPYASKVTLDTLCPHCTSGKRHRALAFYLENNTNWFNSNEASSSSVAKLLHFAAEEAFYNKFLRMKNIDYYPVDFNPDFPRKRDVVDIQNIKYSDDMFDFIICSHVLCSVPDDIKAMSELARVLKKDDLSALYIMERLYDGETFSEIFRQNNFYYTYRTYGLDIVDRLKDAGFDVEIVRPNMSFTEQEILCYGLNREEYIFKCTVSKLTM